jgi:hypothetical protein
MADYSFESMPEFSDNSPIDVARLNAIIRNLNSLNRYLQAIASRIPQSPPLLDDSTTNPTPNPTDPTNTPGTTPGTGPISGEESSKDIYEATIPYRVTASWDDKGKMRIVYPLSNVSNLVEMTVVPVSIQFRPDLGPTSKRVDMLANGAVSYTTLSTEPSNGSITYKFQGNNLNTSSKYSPGVDYPRAYKNITLNFQIIYRYKVTYFPPSLTFE